jgi:hypothetical protein
MNVSHLHVMKYEIKRYSLSVRFGCGSIYILYVRTLLFCMLNFLLSSFVTDANLLLGSKSCNINITLNRVRNESPLYFTLSNMLQVRAQDLEESYILHRTPFSSFIL